MSNVPKPEYWHCVIGPVDRNLLGNGADAPPRQAASDAISKLVNNSGGTFEAGIWSGWGVTEWQAELAKAAVLYTNNFDALWAASEAVLSARVEGLAESDSIEKLAEAVEALRWLFEEE